MKIKMPERESYKKVKREVETIAYFRSLCDEREPTLIATMTKLDPDYVDFVLEELEKGLSVKEVSQSVFEALYGPFEPMHYENEKQWLDDLQVNPAFTYELDLATKRGRILGLLKCRFGYISEEIRKKITNQQCEEYLKEWWRIAKSCETLRDFESQIDNEQYMKSLDERLKAFEEYVNSIPEP